MSEAIVLRDFAGVPEITPDAFKLRDEAIAAAQPCRQVTNDDEQQQAVLALRRLKELRNGLEQTRKSVKAPVLDLGRKIDALAADFIDDALKQEGRLQGMINHYQRKQREVARTEAREGKTLEQEAQELEERAATELDADKRRALLDAAFDKRMEADVLAGSAIVQKPSGLVVRERVNFKLTDPIVFCQAYPQFWKWKEDDELLKLDRLRVLEELNKEQGIFHVTRFPEERAADGDHAEFVRPPGMQIFAETKAHVR